MLRWSMMALLLLFQIPALAAGASGSGEPEEVARTIVLVRHGSYVADPAADPAVGPPLSPLGVTQAHLAGARLAALGLHFDAYRVSPMRRARDTATVIADELPGSAFEVDDDLAECMPPTRREEATADTSPAELVACKDRLDRLFERYFHPADGGNRAALLVCHGNMIRYLVTRALGVDTKAWLEMSIRNASITQVRVEADGRFKVITVGGDGFMPASMLTGATGDDEGRDQGVLVPGGE